jgi:Tol biopolymer transport system component
VSGSFNPGDGPFAWSPDGSRVVFGRFVNGQPDRMCHSQGGAYEAAELLSATIVIDATSDWSIGSPLVAEAAPARYAWSPDGGSVLMSAPDPRLWVGDPRSAAVVDLTPALATIGAGDLAHARWAPDGRSIAFVYSSAAGEMLGEVVVADRSARTLGANGEAGNAPAWSPDGRTIAVVRGFNGGTITLVSADAALPEVGLSSPRVEEFLPFGWSPDGAWLACTAQGGALTLVAANGSEVRTLDGPWTGDKTDFIAWSPG